MTKNEICEAICFNEDFIYADSSHIPMGEVLMFEATHPITENEVKNMFEFEHCGKVHFNEEQGIFSFIISNGSSVKIK